MPLSMSALSRPALERGLEALSALLGKGRDFAAAKALDDAVLLQARLFPDMFPLVRQVQSASDTAKGVVARLSGTDNPNFPDTETSFAGLEERIGKTLAFIRSVPAETIDGSESRIVEVKARRTLTFEGASYLLGFALPNFYFHVAMTHAILRHNGVEAGKMDYLGNVPLVSVAQIPRTSGRFGALVRRGALSKRRAFHPNHDALARLQMCFRC